MSLPPVDPAVAAEAVALLPARLRKRLDEVVAQVATWPVEQTGEGVTVRPDGQVSIALRAPVVTAGDAVCSCLLAPKCLHRAAVLNAAPVRSADPPEAAPAESAQPEAGLAEAVLPEAASSGSGSSGSGSSGSASSGSAEGQRTAQVGPAQAAAARGLWAATAAVLANGMPGAGAVAQADLLRAVHQARATGLHTPAAAAIRVVERLRSGRREDPGFRRGDLADDLREVLAACHRLSIGDGTVAGTARRDYEPVGDLRLYGLFSEPIRTATGHAGAATYLADATGRLWVISDVRPADQPATADAVRGSVDLGDVRLSHHALARAGLRAVNAHASAAGRLSHGRARQAVSATGAGWFESPLDALWQVEPADQAARWLSAAALPAHERPAPHDLAFLDGVILGADRHGLLLDAGGRAVTVGAAHEDPALPYVTNLRLLAAHAAGRSIRLIGRFTGPRRVDGLAFAAGWLPSGFGGGHIDLGATALTRADLDTAGPPQDQTAHGPASPAQDQPAAGPHGDRVGADRPEERLEGVRPPAAEYPPPPLHLLRHQLERVVAAGRAALLSGVDQDARRLTAAHLATAGAVLTALGAAGSRRTRDVFGRLDPHDADHLARAWLAAAVFEHAASRAATLQSWGLVLTQIGDAA
ncbi:hypothetical protein [Actinoplanes sp. HUAS TT8]|uniref:hypothetical protein n=1 Tax=Actinoplanes sp. HUAS TT8 TaxID=3447453 RepID=UPI003F524ED8